MNTDEQCPVLFRPVLADIRQNIVVSESYHASPACPSDKGIVKMKLSTKHWREYGQEKIKVCGETPIAVTLCSPQTSHGLSSIYIIYTCQRTHTMPITKTGKLMFFVKATGVFVSIRGNTHCRL